MARAPRGRGRPAKTFALTDAGRAHVEEHRDHIGVPWQEASAGMPAGLHDLRKAAKRLRYACEVAEPALGKRARRLRLRAKTLASVLGEVQDALVLQQTAVELVSEAAGHRSAGEVSFVLGRLHARLDVQIEHLHADAGKAARRVQSRKVTAWLG